MTFVMAFHHDWRNRGETGMVGTVIGMKTGTVARKRGAMAIISKCSKLSA